MIKFEDIKKEQEKYQKEREEHRKKIDAMRDEEWNRIGVCPIENKDPPKEWCDHPNTIENSTATVLWIVVMVVGSIFKGSWMIWLIATVIWSKFITRHDK